MTIGKHVFGAILVASSLLSSCSGGGSGGRGDLGDRDGDGLPDRLERLLASDPLDSDDPFEEGAQDDPTTEGPGPDGIPDGLERYLRSLGARPPITAQTDSDRDQVPDALEVAAGLDPFDANDPVFNGAADLDGNAGPALDGVSDGLESYLTQRGAAVPLTPDSDSDRDGIPDQIEVRSGSNAFRAADPPLGAPIDLDQDDVPDWLEVRDGSDPLNADFPTFDGADDDDDELGPAADGMADGLEGWLVRRGASKPVNAARDSDADGLPDAVEVRGGSDPFDEGSPIPNGALDDDHDGLTNSLERLLSLKGTARPAPSTDTDGDLIPDFAEALSGTNPYDAAVPTLFAHLDLDGDGLDDFLEYVLRTDPLDPDSPLPAGAEDRNDATGPARDALTDAVEALLIERGSIPPVTTYSDRDGDGLSDFVELRWVSDLRNPDSPFPGGALDSEDASGPAGDGISDAAELALLALGATGPIGALLNSDADVIPDAIELATGTNWLDSRSPRPYRSADIDADGAFDYIELLLGFDPRAGDAPLVDGGADNDDDGLSDALEHLLLLTSTPAPVTPESDSDGDGLFDYLELHLASDRHDGHSPIEEGGLDLDDRTGPAGDGISDALEFFLIAAGAARPVLSRSDSDGDALPDALEARLAFDPFDADSPLKAGAADDDDDGVSNALELVLVRLGALAPVDGSTDSDLDGAPDALELFAGSDAFDADLPVPGGSDDSDGDGLSNALETVLVRLGAVPPVGPASDTDEDGVPDAYEIRSSTHPLRADHPLVDGGRDLVDATGPADTLSDALELLLLRGGATAPVTRGSDSDSDGAPDHLEAFALASPFDAHSPVPNGAQDDDGDRVTNALEAVLIARGARAPVTPRTETDADGAPDAFEVSTGAHPNDADVPIPEGDGLRRDQNAATGPNGDRISDAFEALLIQLGCQAPIDAASDHDGDGLPDAFEAQSLTNPLDADSPFVGGAADSNEATGPSGDLLSDGLEAALIALGALGPVTEATDSDGDGVPDVYEVLKGSDPFDALDRIAPGSRPTVTNQSMEGIPFEGRMFTGRYTYADAEFDPEGPTEIRWLRDGVAIPLATGASYTVTPEDYGKTLSFEVRPVSRFAFPPETLQGAAQVVARGIPVPDFPRGEGGPAGLGVTDGQSSLRLWLRTEEGLDLADGRVRGWNDQSGSKNHAVEVSPSRRPVLVTGLGTSGAQAVRFEGGQHLFLPRPVESDFSIVAVFATTSTASNASWWLSPAILGGEVPGSAPDYHYGINGGKPLVVIQDRELTTNLGFANGSAHSFSAQRLLSNGRVRIVIDGTTRGSMIGTTVPLDGPASLYLGSSTNNAGFWTGDLFELCAFAHELTISERKILDEYFGARFRVNSPGDLYPHAGSHPGDVAGIGRETELDLVPSTEGPGLLRIERATALSDGDYLIFGTDRPRDFTFLEDAPGPLGVRMRRTWAFQVTDGGAGDGVGRVNLRFRVSGLFLSPRASDFALLFDDDGAFFDARVVGGPSVYDPLEQTIEFRDVVLGPERFLSLAVRPL